MSMRALTFAIGEAGGGCLFLRSWTARQRNNYNDVRTPRVKKSKALAGAVAAGAVVALLSGCATSAGTGGSDTVTIEFTLADGRTGAASVVPAAASKSFCG